MRQVPKHCCSANNAVERCCMIANGIEFVENNGRHTHTHTHTHIKFDRFPNIFYTL